LLHEKLSVPDGAPTFADHSYGGPGACIFQEPLAVIVVLFDFSRRLARADLLQI
jgi:hypothetical protein